MIRRILDLTIGQVFYCVRHFTVNLVYVLTHFWKIPKARRRLKQIKAKIWTIPRINDFLRDNMILKSDKGDRRSWPIAVMVGWNEKLQKYSGDCMTGDMEIICLDENKNYCLKRIDSLESFKGKVLSYNFLEKKYELKKIINWWDKGIQDVYEYRIRGRGNIKCTRDHKLFKWKDSLGGYFDILPLSYIKNLSSHRRQIAIATQIPNLNKRSEYNENDMYIAGQYLSEGWKDKNKGNMCFISGDDIGIQNRLKIIFFRLSIRYSESKRRKHAYFSILKGRYCDFLAQFGDNSFTKDIPNWILSLDKERLTSLYESFIDGDGWRNSNVFHRKTYGWCTSSDELKKKLFLISLILGRPINITYQKNHQGFGINPIWRAEYSRNSYLHKEAIPKVGKGTIREEGYLGKQKVYDIEVEDNHNFILYNGVIAHNCDDYLTMSKYLAKCGKFKTQSWSIFGWRKRPGEPRYWAGHALCIIKVGDVTWIADNKSGANVRRFVSWKVNFPWASERIKRWY